MKSLENTIKSGNKALEREVKKSIRSESYKVTEWKGRRVVPVEMWEKLARTRVEKMMLKYLPEDYIKPFLFLPQDEQERRERELWSADWISYLHEKKKASFGEYRCRSCILHPDSRKHSENIYDIIIKGINVEFPCKVVNIYKCPYDENDDVSKLFSLKEILEVTDKAISHAEQLTRNNDHTYFADFERDLCEEYSDLYFDSKPSRMQVEAVLSETEFSKIPIRTINDLYNVLIDKKLLGKIIDQYIQHVQKNEYKHSEQDITEEVRKLDSTKPMIISYFASIKETIKIEELCDHHGRNLQEEKLEFERMKHLYDWIAKEDPMVKKNQTKPKNGLCMDCNGFANILCVNCNKWICDIHWRKHSAKKHGYSDDLQNSSPSIENFQTKHLRKSLYEFLASDTNDF